MITTMITATITITMMMMMSYHSGAKFPPPDS